MAELENKEGTQHLGEYGWRDVYLSFHDDYVRVDGELTAAELRQLADWLEERRGARGD